jgi:hypothetical protein
VVRPRRFLDGRASYAAKRRTLEIVFLNCHLEDANLVPTMRKPFDALVEGLLQKGSRGDETPFELFIAGIRAWADDVLAIVGLEPHDNRP